jgi:Threonine aldolase
MNHYVNGTNPMNALRYFASDNNSGVHPRILEALARVNSGNADSYGADPYTEEAVQTLKNVFGQQARPWFVFLGTAANVLGLKSMVRSHHAILCSKDAHIHCDECGAPEAITGSKLIPLPSHHGKIYPDDCLKALHMREAVHHNYPKVLSITQSTECGTVYTLEELRSISEFCKKNDLYLHMDGARLSNAAAAMGLSLREISADVGVDVLSFGGTKNGLMFGEVIIFFNDELGHAFAYVRKQHMQLVSKMRFMAVQFLEYLKDGLWHENALWANRMASLLAGELRQMEHVRIVHPVDVNALFVRMHKDAIAKLQERFYFYVQDAEDAEGFPKDWQLVRLMTSFDTTEEQVMEFADAIRTAQA